MAKQSLYDSVFEELERDLRGVVDRTEARYLDHMGERQWCEVLDAALERIADGARMRLQELDEEDS